MNQKLKLIRKDCKKIRKFLLNEYPDNPSLQGRCVEASQMVMSMLITKYAAFGEYIDGYVFCKEFPSDLPGEEIYWQHCWVESNIDSDKYIVDITLSQFNENLDEPVDDINIYKLPKEKPSFMRYVKSEKKS